MKKKQKNKQRQNVRVAHLRPPSSTLYTHTHTERSVLITCRRRRNEHWPREVGYTHTFNNIINEIKELGGGHGPTAPSSWKWLGRLGRRRRQSSAQDTQDTPTRGTCLSATRQHTHTNARFLWTFFTLKQTTFPPYPHPNLPNKDSCLFSSCTVRNINWLQY